MFYVYILQSLKDNKYYIGSTNDIDRRLEEHNVGKVTSTRYRRPLKVIYKEECSSLSEARRRELVIKKMKGGIQFKALLRA